MKILTQDYKLIGRKEHFTDTSTGAHRKDEKPVSKGRGDKLRGMNEVSLMLDNPLAYH